MHIIDSLTYVGQPNETVSVTTFVDDGGQIAVTLDGQSVPENTTFRLPGELGGHSVLQIALLGPDGASCAVGIATVDGGTDVDMLLVQTHVPAPVHFYRFSVAGAQNVLALGKLKAAAPIAPQKKSKTKSAGAKGGK